MTIKLRRLTALDEKEGKYHVTLPGSLNADLTLYADAYREAYGEEAPAADKLITAIVAQFFAGDSAFQTLKKQRAAGEPRTRTRKSAAAATTQEAA